MSLATIPSSGQKPSLCISHWNLTISPIFASISSTHSPISGSNTVLLTSMLGMGSASHVNVPWYAVISMGVTAESSTITLRNSSSDTQPPSFTQWSLMVANRLSPAGSPAKFVPINVTWSPQCVHPGGTIGGQAPPVKSTSVMLTQLGSKHMEV